MSDIYFYYLIYLYKILGGISEKKQSFFNYSVMQSINTLVCYGKRICAYRMGIKNIYDRSPNLEPTSYGIKKSKYFAKNLGYF